MGVVPQQKVNHVSMLSSRIKWGYGIADIGGSGSFTVINIFLLFFLIEVVGLRPGLAGIVLLAGRVLDAITDPIMGMITDRTRSRWGRRKPYIWAGAVPFGVSFGLIWMLPEGAESVIFTMAVLALALHMIIFTITHVPYMALTPELAPEYSERTTLTSYRVGVSLITGIVAAATPPLLIATFNSWQGLPEGARFGWMIMGVAFGAMMTLGYLVMATLVPEPSPPDAAPGKLNIWQEYCTAFKVYGYPQILLLFVVVTVGVGVLSSILPFFLISSLRLDPGEQTTVLGLLFITAALFLPLWNWLSDRNGKKTPFAVGLIILAAALLLLTFFSPPGALSPILLTMAIFAGLGYSAVALFPWAMLPDVVEFDMLKGGMRREGLLVAIFTFAQKFAFALSAFFNAQMLEFVGYQRGVIEQTARALSGIQWMIGPVTAFFFLLTFVLVVFYPITKARHDAARAELAER